MRLISIFFDKTKLSYLGNWVITTTSIFFMALAMKPKQKMKKPILFDFHALESMR